MSLKKVIAITAPSGAGKTSIVKRLLTDDERLDFSVSACTREAREGEVDGQDYYFLSKQEFQKKILDDEFAEWEEVYEGSYYGTLKSEIERIWEEGKAVVFDIDVAGALTIKDAYKDKALTVFISPPTEDALRERLSNRNTETEESMERRLQKAALELTYANKFDKVIVNDVLETAVAEAKKLVDDFLTQD